MNMIRDRFTVALVTFVVLAALPLAAQTRGEDASSANLRMRETGIQGERQRPDVLFVIPTGRGGPIVSSRLRDYSYEIQEPVVKMWLEGELRIARGAPPSSAGIDFDWREAVEAAKSAPARPGQGPVAVPQSQLGRGPRGNEPTIPREALSGAR
jgi:hypothetical protein